MSWSPENSPVWMFLNYKCLRKVLLIPAYKISHFMRDLFYLSVLKKCFTRNDGLGRILIGQR